MKSRISIKFSHKDAIYLVFYFLPFNEWQKKVPGENYWVFFQEIRMDNSSNFSRFLTRNYIVFLDPHEELKTEKNDMPSPTASTLSYWCIWFGKPINRILSYYNYIHNGLKASWTRVVFISFQFLVVIFDGFSKWSIPRSLWNFEKKIIKNWNQGYIW